MIKITKALENTKKVQILYKRWSVDNKEQYAKIARFWKIVEEYVDCRYLQGYGTDWSNDNGGDFLYGIIFENGKLSQEVINAVRREIPDIKVDNSFSIPARYSEIFEGRSVDIDALYDKIWSVGPVAHELEEFSSDGNCKIRVIYKK